MTLECGAGCEDCNHTGPAGPFCSCEWPYINRGDLAPDPAVDCTINQIAVVGLQWTGVLLWAITLVGCLLACLFARRSTKGSALAERLSMLWLGLGALFDLMYHARSAMKPGVFGVTLDLVTTIFFFLGHLIAYSFIYLLPFIQTGTSVVPFALREAFPRHIGVVKIVAFLLLTFSLTVHSLLLAVYIRPEKSTAILTVYFTCSALWGCIAGITLISVTTTVIVRMQSMVNNSDIPPHHRNTLVIAVNSMINVRRATILTLAFIVPSFIAMAISSVAQRQAYIFIPIASFVFALLHLRHVIRSILISRTVAIQQCRSESRFQTKGDNGDNYDDQEGNDDDADIDYDERPKRGPLGKRLKFKRIRPPRLMTRVTEEPSQGTNIVTVAQGDAESYANNNTL